MDPRSPGKASRGKATADDPKRVRQIGVISVAVGAFVVLATLEFLYARHHLRRARALQPAPSPRG